MATTKKRAPAAKPVSKKKPGKPPRPIQVGLGKVITAPVGFILKAGKLLWKVGLKSPQAVLICTFFNSLDGSGWSTKTQQLWVSAIVPFLGELGIDASSTIDNTAQLYAKYGRYIRGVFFVVKGACGAIGFDLTPTLAEKEELKQLPTQPSTTTPAPSTTTPPAAAASSGGGGGGGGGMLFLAAAAAALLLLKK
jgi:hypothetical protein